LLLAGCRDEEIRGYSAPKEAPAPPMEMAQTPPTEEPEIIEWTLPAGWRELPGEGMRFATLVLEEGSAAAGPVELRVTPLGLAARDPLANINRWREQIGLGHIGPEEMNGVARTVEIDGRTAQVVNMVGPAEANRPAQQVLAAILPGDQRVWFFLVLDDARRVGRFAPAFDEFLRSVRFRESQVAMAGSLPPGHPPVDPGDAPPSAAGARDAGAGTGAGAGAAGAGAAGTSGRVAAGDEPRVSWTTPAGWRERPGDGAFRVASFEVAESQQRAEVTITRFPGGVGGLLANINRWRGQVGLQPVADVSQQPLETLEVASQPAQMLDLVGPAAGSGAARQRLLVVLVARGDTTWFLKMTGPEAFLDRQKPIFVEFACGIRFDGERS
jgi:hypothetical protein